MSLPLIPGSLRVIEAGGVVFVVHENSVIVVAFGLMALLNLLIKRTKVGKATASHGSSTEAATFTGFDVDGSLCGIPDRFRSGRRRGTLSDCSSPGRLLRGFQAGLKGFTAAVLGGIGNIYGAMFGGIILGW